MTLVQPLAVFADVVTSSNAFAVNPNYLIGSASNADPYGIATMELLDDDYAVMPMSSIGTVTNTVNSTGLYVAIRITDGSRSSLIGTFAYKNSDNRYNLKYTAPDGYYITRVQPILYRDDLPSPGSYSFSFDYASHFSYTVLFMSLFSNIHSNNVADQTTSLSLSINEQSGDVYVAPQNFNFNNVEYTAINMAIPETDYVNTLGGSFAINFTRIAAGDYQSTGVDYTSDNYQSDVAGSLSNISSSIGDMSESLDSAAENLEYISTSQNLIIQGIDNVIMHISDQLYAFWDQLYNLIHEPTYARLGDILDAIRNLDLEITVEMTEVTNAVNKMNQEVQNKLQQTTDKITGGFDNSVMESEANKLDTSISEYDEAEQSVIQNVNDSLDNFEFDAELGEYQSIVSVISDFLQELYDSSGGFKVLINLSMLLSLAGIVIGIYRFGGGS